MPLYVVDTNGRHGQIEDDLSLSFRGAEDTAESIRECIDEAEREADSLEEAYTSLFVELPEQCAVREVGRVEDGGEER